MQDSGITRRRFLKTAGAVGLTGSACLGRFAAAQPTGDPLKRVGIDTLAADAPRLATFRAGVKKMRELPARHPFSWVFQANIHWRPFYPAYVYQQAAETDDPAMQLFRDDEGFSPEFPVFNTCPHGNWFFLPWHRAYLYYFERILRWATGDPKFTLPYWNYTDQAQRELPKTFRDPTDKGALNPLYLPATATFRDPDDQPQTFPMRDAALNAGLSQLTDRVTSVAALAAVPFANALPNPPVEAFGSPQACDLTCQCGSGAVERIPHNQVHNAVGGAAFQVGDAARVGFMGDVSTAARDPLFWLHHANIDRLWSSWAAAGGGRKNPEDPTWLNYEFTFYDVGPGGKPTPTTITPAQVLATKDLGYEYDQLQAAPAAPAAPAVIAAAHTFHSLAETPAPATRKGPAAKPDPHAMNAAGIALSNTRTRAVKLTVTKAVAPKGLPAAFADLTPKGAAPPRTFLSLEGIELSGPPGVYYEVYLGAPPATADATSYVGSLSFFAAVHTPDPRHGAGGGHGRKPFSDRLPIPEALAKRLREGKLDDADLEIRFVPKTGTEPVPTKAAAAPAKEQPGIVTIRQARLIVMK